jgi:hypothetical protein
MGMEIAFKISVRQQTEQRTQFGGLRGRLKTNIE